MQPRGPWNARRSLIAAAILGMAAVIALYALDEVSVGEFVLSVIGSLALVGVCYLILVLRAVHVRLQRVDAAQARLQIQIDNGLATGRDVAVQQLEASRNDIATRMNELEEAVTRRNRRTVRRLQLQEYAEIEALLDLRGQFDVRATLPPTRGWAASPDVLRTLVELILARKPKLVVECGSGASSVWMGYALERVGGRLVSLEHDSAFGSITAQHLSRHGLGNHVELRHAPLEPWTDNDATGTGEEWTWYSVDAIKDLHDIDLIFVDGPPGDTRDHARYPAVPALLSRCAEGAVLVLDDSARADERQIVDRWMARYPHLTEQQLAHEKGCSLIFLSGVP